ncbi:DUF6503 family protein [Christiangramia aquimixticola]|uniref:DUF6503 family protein n=1 Tax=Christiangramia aquimixticola TaxID=1697558 RepID=UPI003AA8D13D
MMKRIAIILLFFCVLGCKEEGKTEKVPVEPNNGIGDGALPPKVLTFSENIEEAHNKPAFKMQRAVSFDIDLDFGGKQRLKGTVSMTTNSSKVRIESEDGFTITFNGEMVGMKPADASAKNARFDIFTWQYFFAMPFKLTDPGTVWEDSVNRKLDGIVYETAKLSFKQDTGDSPDDWYIIYKDPETNLLKAAAYIVTFNTGKASAENNPHVIEYSDYTVVENVSLAQTWTFHDWDEENGPGKILGRASISNINFFIPKENYFKIPADAQIIEK